VLQYYIHRDLLHGSAGGPVARLHQTWHHSITAPYAFTAAYDHPLPYLLLRVLPLYVPAVAFRFHLTTYLIMIAVTSLEELFTYSGYSVLPSTIMLKGMARRVDAHMQSRGDGNYGPLGVLDWVNGTTLGGRDVTDDLGDEVEKHHVEDRANGMANKLRSKVKKGKGRD
jgi:sterol desaturase/sphingolipid hydroxylase (fatty acid hydroxylase superfamily)